MHRFTVTAALCLVACGSPKPAAPDATTTTATTAPVAADATSATAAPVADATTATTAAADATTATTSASVEDAVASADIPSAIAAPDPVIAAISGFGQKRADALRARADAAWATGPQCREGSDAEREAAVKSARTWLAKKHAKVALDESGPKVECFDDDRAIVSAEGSIGSTDSDPESREWFLVSIAGAKVELLRHESGSAGGSCWTPAATFGVVGARDLDGDGKLDFVTVVSDSMDTAFSISASIAGTTSYGGGQGSSGPASLQPDAAEHTLVVRTISQAAEESGAGPSYFCIGAKPPWSECPAAAQAARFDIELAAAEDLAKNPDSFAANADALAVTLATLEVPEAEAKPMIAAAKPGPASYLIAGWLAEKRAEGEPSAGEPMVTWHDDALETAARAAVGVHACAPLQEADGARLTQAVTAWIAEHDGAAMKEAGCVAPDCVAKPGQPTLEQTCVTKSSAVVAASWSNEQGSDLTILRYGLLLVRAAGVTLLADTSVEDRMLDMEGRPTTEVIVATMAATKDDRVLVMRYEPYQAWLDDSALAALPDGTEPLWAAQPTRFALALEGVAWRLAGDRLTAWALDANGGHELASMTLPTLDDARDAAAPAATGSAEVLALMRANALARVPFDVLDQIDALGTDAAGRARVEKALAALGADDALTAKVKTRMAGGR